MPGSEQERKTEYNVGKLRAGFGSKAGNAYLNAAELAVASSYEDSLIDDEITVDESQFDADLTKKKVAKPDSFFDKHRSFYNLQNGTMDFSVHGTRFKGRKGTQIEGAAVTINKGLALDLTNNIILADKRSESAYISEEDTTQPVLAYYDKDTKSLKNIPLNIKKGRQNSLLAQDSIDMESDLPIDISLDEKSGYRLSANGIILDNEHAEFLDGVIYRNTEKGNESNAGYVDIWNGEIQFEDVNWRDKFGISNETEELSEEDLVKKYEEELGLTHVGQINQAEDESSLEIDLSQAEDVDEDSSLEIDLSQVEYVATGDKKEGGNPVNSDDDTSMVLDLDTMQVSQDDDTEEYKAAMQILELDKTIMGMSMYRLALHHNSVSLDLALDDKARVYTRIKNWKHDKKRINKVLKTYKAYVDKKVELLSKITITPEVFAAAKAEGLEKYHERIAGKEEINAQEEQMVPVDTLAQLSTGDISRPETEEEKEARMQRRAALKNSYEPKSREIRSDDTILDAYKLQKGIRAINPNLVDPLDDWSTSYLLYGKADRAYAVAEDYVERDDKRGRTNRRFFDIENPTKIASYWYAIAFVRMLLGMDNTEELNKLAEATNGEFAQDMNGIQLNIMEATARLHFAKKCLAAIAKGDFSNVKLSDEEIRNMGMPTSSFVEQDEWKDTKFVLSIFPPLSFYLSFQPNFHMNFVHDFFIESAPNSPDADQLVELSKEAVLPLIEEGDLNPVKMGTKVVEMLIGMVELQAGLYLALTGSMSLGITAGLLASIGTIVPTVSLLSADASLFARLAMHGTGNDQSIFDVTPLVRVKLSDFDPDSPGGGTGIEKLMLDVNAGLAIDGVVGTTGTLKSSVFNNYTKQLWKKNFATWDLARLSFNRHLESKEPGQVFSSEDAKSAFSLSILHHEIINTNPKDYGFRFANEATEISSLLDEGNDETEKDLSALDKAGEVLSANPSEMELEKLNETLETLKQIEISVTTMLERTNYTEGHVGGNAVLQEQIRRTQTDFAAQSGILEALSSFTPEERAKAESADEIITKLGVDAKAFNEFVELAVSEDALEKVATLEAITSYENEKMSEEAANSDFNLKLLDDFEYKDDETKANDPEKFEEDRRKALVKHYLDKAKGWDTITARLTDYADPEQLRKYERTKIEEETKKHQDNIDKLETQISDKNANPNEANEEIFNYYKTELAGKEFLKLAFSDFLDIDSLILFEKGKMLKSGNNEVLFALKEQMSASLDLVKDNPEKEDDELRTLREALKEAISKEDAAKFIGMSVSADEILEFENERIKRIMSEILPDFDSLDEKAKFELLTKKLHSNYSFEAQQRANQNMRGKGKAGTVFAYTGGMALAGAHYSADALKNLKDRIKKDRLKQILRENVRIEDLILYEKQQADLDAKSSLDADYADSLKSGIDPETGKYSLTFNKNSVKSANYARSALRKKRVATLQKYLDRYRSLKDDGKKEALLSKVRQMYFDGSIDKLHDFTTSKAVLPGMKNDGILDSFARGDFDLGKTDGGYEYMNAKMYEDISNRAVGRFKERVALVEQMKESGESQAHIYEAYASMGGHLWWLGADAISQNKLKVLLAGDEGANVIDKLSIQELYDLTNNIIRMNSRINFFPRIGKSIKNGIKSKIPDVLLDYMGFDKAIDSDTQRNLKLAGYAERFERLAEFKKRMEDPYDKEFSMLSEEEKRAKLFNYYTVELGAGNGLFKAMNSGKDTTDDIGEKIKMITPAMLIAYEKRCIERESAKRRKRLEFLEGKQPGDDLSGYRKLATTDGTGFKGSINWMNAKIRNNYRTGADKALNAEDVLNEDAIRDFEKKRKEKSNSKRQKRLEALKEARVDVKGDVLKTYRAVGGGDGFAKKHAAKINDEKKILLSKSKTKEGQHEYLLRFQNLKVEQAKKELERATKPLNALDSQRETMRKILAVTKDRRKKAEAAIAAVKKKAVAAVPAQA